MPRLKVASVESPSEEVVKKANKIFYVTDARGRRLGLKKPGILAQYRLVEMLGTSAQNSTFMGMLLPITFVCEIDEDSVSFPASRRELDALIQRVDEDGLMAIQKGIEEEFGTDTQGTDEIKNS